MKTVEICPKCDGTGTVAKGNELRVCSFCDGEGKVAVPQKHTHFDPQELRK